MIASREGAPLPPAANPQDEPARDPAEIPGDRGLPSVNQVRSVQAYITRILSLALLAVLVTGLLLWYVREVRGTSARGAATAAASTQARASGETKVSPLGPIVPRHRIPVTDRSVAKAGEDPDELTADEEGGDAGDDNPGLRSVLGDRPPPPHWSDYAPAEPAALPARGTPTAALPAPTVMEDRRLAGAVFTAQTASLNSSLGPNGGAGGNEAAADAAESSTAPTVDARAANNSLWSSATVRAERLPTRRWWLAKGTFLDGTLETAIDSTLPGLVTAVLASDTYGADGQVVLLARGTRLLGEVRGSVARGQSRLLVEWQEARTPSGLVVELKSPGTDSLGRSGLTGEVDRHFVERFGAALLVSVLDGAVQAAVASSRKGGGDQVVVTPSGSQDIASEALKDTIGIPTTIRVAPGTRLQVLVARDVDFRGVYGSERRISR